jgi:hypothetical protein
VHAIFFDKTRLCCCETLIFCTTLTPLLIQLSIANLSRNFSLVILVCLLWIVRGINLGNFPTYSCKNSYEFFQVTSSDILFHQTRIVREINLGKILRIFLTKEFFLGYTLSRPNYLRGGSCRKIKPIENRVQMKRRRGWENKVSTGKKRTASQRNFF